MMRTNTLLALLIILLAQTFGNFAIAKNLDNLQSQTKANDPPPRTEPITGYEIGVNDKNEPQIKFTFKTGDPIYLTFRGNSTVGLPDPDFTGPNNMLQCFAPLGCATTMHALCAHMDECPLGFQLVKGSDAFPDGYIFRIWRSYLPAASTSKEPGQITNFYYEMNNIASHGLPGGNGNFGSFAVARNAGNDDPGLEIDMCFKAPGETLPPSYYNGPKTLYHMELPGNETKLMLNLLNTCTFQRLKFEVTDKEMNVYEYFDTADKPHMKICTDLVVVKPQGSKGKN